MIIAGIDYSISSPALCVHDTSAPFDYADLKFLAMPSSSRIDGEYDNIRIVQNLGSKALPVDRYDLLGRTFVEYIVERGVERVYLEDYAFGARGKVFHIGENCGILKNYCRAAGIVIETIAPTALKKFATEKGNAKKEQMIEKFVEETGVDLWEQFRLKTKTKSIPSPIDDIVDSYFLTKYGYTIIEENLHGSKENL